MANAKRPGNLTDLPDHIVQELIRIEQADKASNPERQQNEQMMQALMAATGAVNGLMQLKTGIDQNHQQAFAALTDANTKLSDAANALSSTDQTGNFQQVVQGLDKLSREIQLKLVDVEKALKIDIKPTFNPNISVDAPQVHVDAPDLKPLRDLLAQELPKQVNSLANAIPDFPETDLTTVESKLDKLADIMRDVRDRKIPIPQFPTQLKVTNPDGTTLGGSTSNPEIVSTTRTKFRDNFAIAGSQPDPAIWTLSNPDGHVITRGGNTAGSSYLRISLNPLIEATEVSITSKQTFSLPMRAGFGITMSQRIVGQEVFAGMVGDDGSGNIDTSTTAWNSGADMAMPASVTVAVANVIPIVLPSHGLVGGDRISTYGSADPRVNVGPVVVTVIDANTISIPATLAIGTYNTTGGFVRYSDPMRYAYNGAGYLWENAVPTNGSCVTRRNGADFRTLNTALPTTAATQSNVSPYSDAFNTAGNFEEYLSLEEVDYRGVTADSISAVTGSKFTQANPDENPLYHVQVRARTLIGYTRPIARITAIAKTGTTTATVTTDVAHGLTTSDWVQIYGVRDQVNFPNLAAQTAVASVIDSTHFTVVIGTASTTSSLDGNVWRVQGSGLAPGAFPQVIQSLSVTNNILTLIGNATWATPIPGESMYLHGLNSAVSAYEGAYKVLRVSTTTLELAPLTGTISNITSTTTGGTVIRMTDVRVHFARVMDYTRLVTEVVGGRGSTDANNAVGIYAAGGTIASTQSTGLATTQWNAAGFAGLLVTDVVAAALTVTTTTAAITPGLLLNIGANANTYGVIVTAATGTLPTLDVGVEESIDGGTNYTRIYDFPRITATGSYTSPQIPKKTGSIIRYVQTVTGTTPSFTRSIVRNMFSTQAPYWRQFIDRSIVLTTLNSTTPTYVVEGAKDYTLAIKVGAITTTAPVLQLQGNDDGTTTGWYNIGTPVTAVASTVVSQSFVDMPARNIRAIVTTAGVGVTADYILLKATGR